MAAFWTPLAKLLIRLNISPDVVTIVGAVVTVTLALTLLPTGHLFWGAVLIGVFALADSLDGVLARLSGHSTVWGAFLDSTLDRFADGAVFAGITAYLFLHRSEHFYTWAALAALACLVLGGIVPYTRAKADSIGANAQVGIFERQTRLIIALVPIGFLQFGLPAVVVAIALTILALGTLWTVVQRMLAVREQVAGQSVPLPQA